MYSVVPDTSSDIGVSFGDSDPSNKLGKKNNKYHGINYKFNKNMIHANTNVNKS